jgi:hypothetical protein
MSRVDHAASLGDQRDEIVHRAKVAGIQTEVEDAEDLFGPNTEGEKDLYIYLPNGRRKYKILADVESAASISETISSTSAY